eukprot:TRINITY_DN12393_c0_g1_i3.p3 TRINITY_DN12393_c0_g1~~TRINITY_DN12393_c0_g1_i3.p3  ORF type:complete len:117 (-),score=2.13 TRINITY_DN12393_c0_g1_i3:659-1009(-)
MQEHLFDRLQRKLRTQLVNVGHGSPSARRGHFVLDIVNSQPIWYRVVVFRSQVPAKIKLDWRPFDERLTTTKPITCPQGGMCAVKFESGSPNRGRKREEFLVVLYLSAEHRHSLPD